MVDLLVQIYNQI